MNIAAIIQARMGSTRLPGKVLLNLCGRPVLWHVFNRVSKSEFLNSVVVATTTNPEDDVIEQYCISEKIPVFRGSSDDVLDRYYQCAKSIGADVIVRITADCPLHDSTVIDIIIREYLEGKHDFVTNTFEYTYPDGLDTEVFSFASLEKAWLSARLPSEREHVTPYIRNSPGFTKKNVAAENPYPPYRLTLDQQEDFEFISKIFTGIGKVDFSLEETTEYLRKHPDLLTINQDIVRNEGYIKAMILDAKNGRIEGERIYLRGLKESDASATYRDWLNNTSVNSYLETKTTTIDELKHYIKEKDEHLDCLFLGIFLKSDNRHIGNVKLEPINYHTLVGSIGIMIGDKSVWGKGYCTEAIKLILDYSFKKIGLKKILTGILSDNEGAVRCFQRAGFTLDKATPVSDEHEAKSLEQFLMSVTSMPDDL